MKSVNGALLSHVHLVCFFTRRAIQESKRICAAGASHACVCALKGRVVRQLPAGGKSAECG